MEYKRIQKIRYARACYESAVRILGEKLLLSEGWRPYLHLLVRSRVRRREVVYVFSLWKLDKSPCLSSLPKDLFYLIFTFLVN